jgi:hypothetical protein
MRPCLKTQCPHERSGWGCSGCPGKIHLQRGARL